MSDHEITDEVIPDREIHQQQLSDDADAQPPPIDPATLDDYDQFRAWKAAQEERRKPVDDDMPDTISLMVDGKDQTYRLVRLDLDVLAHLQVLVTFSETEMEQAISLFEALLEPAEFQRLKKDLRPALRKIRAAHLRDAESPSIADTWQAIAGQIADPLMELMNDPKRVASLGGQSATGPTSSTDSTPSALPSSS